MINPLEPGRSRPTRQRKVLIASGIAAVLFLGGLFLALRPSGDDESSDTTTANATIASTETGTEESTSPETTAPPTTAPSTPTETAASGPTRVRINVTGGRPTGGITRVSVEQGEDVLLVVRSDAPETVHLHGYDREAPVALNAPAQIGFKADQPGRFEVELEDSGVLIAEISVEP